MNNFLQKSIAIAVLIIAGAITHYFVLVLPKQSEIENNIKCQEAGRILHKADAAESPSTTTELEGKFKFDKTSNTCVYWGGFITKEGIVHKYIKNTYTNETIAEFMTNVHDGSFLFGDKDKFEKIESMYFGE